MQLDKLKVEELNVQEVKSIDGGAIPVGIAIGWGLMLACSAVALGFKDALDEHNAKSK